MSHGAWKRTSEAIRDRVFFDGYFEMVGKAAEATARYESAKDKTEIIYYDEDGDPLSDGGFAIDGNGFNLPPDVDVSVPNNQPFQYQFAAADPGFVDQFTVEFGNGTLIQISGAVPIAAADLLAAIAPNPDVLPIYQTIVGMLDDATTVDGSDVSDGIEVGAGSDSVEGNAGDDLVRKWKSGDLIYDGGEGSDTLSFQAAFGFPHPTAKSQALIVDLAAGTGQNPYGGSLTLTAVENIVGTDAADRILGTDAANVIGDGIADAGGDTIDGRGGDDVVFLAIDPGAFSIDGGAGTDELIFTVEDNVLGIGQVVLDLLDPGLDTGPFAAGSFANFERYTAATLIAVGGDVFVFGGSNGPDVVTGQNGGLLDEPSVAAEDILSGRGGADTMHGERGRDSLDGGAGDDHLEGGLDNDTLIGTAGNDTLVGGLGFDTAVFSGLRAAYTISFDAPFTTVSGPDGVDLVTGVETLQFADQSLDTPVMAYIQDASLVEGSTRFMGFTLGLTRQSAVNVTVTATTSNGNAIAGSDYIARSAPATIFGSEASGGFNVEIFTDALVEGDESFTVTLSNPVNATLGSTPFATGTIIDDDTIPALPPTDVTVTGGTDDDVLTGGPLRDRLQGLGGADTLSGHAANDVLEGAAGDDVLAGGGGDDALFPGAGSNLIQGGAGTDTLFLAGLRADYVVSGSTGLLLLVRSAGAPEQHKAGGVELIAFAGETVAAGDLLPPPVIDGIVVPTTDGLDFLVGGPLDDSMPGGGGDDILLGLDGDDVVTGDDGNDLLVDAAGGNDSFDGGDGTDVVFGFPGDDLIDTGDGDDIVQAGPGADVLLGGNGIDQLYGEEGDDWIEGGNDLDFVIGGLGADAMFAGDGNDRVHASREDILAYGEEGIFDVLVLEDVSGGFDRIDLGDPGNQNASGTGPFLSGFEAVDATIATGPVSLAGGAVEGRGNVLIASFFDDTITGSDAVDIILAGPGDDVIDAGAGDDTVRIDAGDDTATGGPGADRFDYPGSDLAGAVRITDFTAGDTLALPASLTFDAVLALLVQQGGDAVLTLAPGHVVTLAGVLVVSLDAGDFAFDL